jgi:hypothetical protein
MLLAKNCGLFSSAVYLKAASASVPDAPPQAPRVLSYDSPTAMTVKWVWPKYDGGL